MVWKNMGWSGDPAQERELAENPYYLQFSFRDMCKRAGHGTNYGLSATSLARHLKIKVAHATRFQLLYYGGVVALESVNRWHKADPKAGFDELLAYGKVYGDKIKYLDVPGAFPGIRKWHDSIANELSNTGTLTTPLGRRRQFWGRLNDATTLRGAIAYVPQSTIGDLLNIGLYRVWNELQGEGVQVLGQVHDAILGQVPNDKVDELMPKIVKCMTNPMVVQGRELIIPSSVEVGNTWKNLKTWKGGHNV
jgi:DNA polymerase I-like protein with 3'-5' exonuclease and polymerase domains